MTGLQLGVSFPSTEPFYKIKDGNSKALILYEGHYSARPNRNSKLICGPGGKLLLLTHCHKALVVWRKHMDKCIDERTGQPQQGINCAVFRNEKSRYRSSDLLLAAEAWAWQRWPGERLYTFVDATKIESDNPGYCFKCAGWQTCGRTKSGLLILEKLPIS